MAQTGDLARRKLLPGLCHLATAGFIPGCQIIGVSLDDLDADGFRSFTRKALDEFSGRKVNDADWNAFAQCLDYVPLAAGAEALKAAVEKAERGFGRESRRVHYLSVPPSAACRPCACSAKPASPKARASSWRSPSAPISRARSR